VMEGGQHGDREGNTSVTGGRGVSLQLRRR
jgi:hypothetical protein